MEDLAIEFGNRKIGKRKFNIFIKRGRNDEQVLLKVELNFYDSIKIRYASSGEISG